jgi:cytochrome c
LIATQETLMKYRLHVVTGLMALAVGASAPALANPEEAMTKAGCMACHTKDKKLVGPAFKDIAAKYKDPRSPDLVATLMQKVRAGGKGVYGPIPMPPSGADKIADAELKAAIEFILKS